MLPNNIHILLIELQQYVCQDEWPYNTKTFMKLENWLVNISSLLLGSEVEAMVKPWSSNTILNIPYIFGRRVEGSEGTSALASIYLVINVLVLKLKPSTNPPFLRDA